MTKELVRVFPELKNWPSLERARNHVYVPVRIPDTTSERYYVNQNAQSNGDHEVHVKGCSFFADAGNRIYLGRFSNCRAAITAAKKHTGSPTVAIIAAGTVTPVDARQGMLFITYSRVVELIINVISGFGIRFAADILDAVSFIDSKVRMLAVFNFSDDSATSNVGATPRYRV